MYLASMPNLSDEMLIVVKKILKLYNIDINLQDLEGNTCLHIAINSKNKNVFKEILINSPLRPNLNIKNKLEQTVLWLSLLQSEETNDFEQTDSFPNLLISKGSEINITDSIGDSLLHLCARKNLENAAIFLVNRQAKINLLNDDSETVLHIACENDLKKLVEILLEKGADPNVQSTKATNSQTPMHKAILSNHEDILNLFINFKSNQFINY